MSVNACDRAGCDNVMCDLLSDEYGYICHECFEELVYSGPTTDIRKFMERRIKTGKKREEALARYNVVFPDRE